MSPTEEDKQRESQWPVLADVTPGWLWAGGGGSDPDSSIEQAVSLFDTDISYSTNANIAAIAAAKAAAAGAAGGLTAPLSAVQADAVEHNTGSVYGDADGTQAHRRVLLKKFKITAAPKELNETGYLASIFDILNSFLSRSNVGEFPTRLHLVRLFALQLHQDTVLSNVNIDIINGSLDGSLSDVVSAERVLPIAEDASSLKKQLARVVMGVWRYYEQFLSAVRRFQDLLRGPIERRLKGEVKIGKWDQLSTYGLIEHSERVHKKLNKFIREYQGDVLEYPLTAVLRRELVGDLASEQGDLKAAIAVPPATSVFPMLKSMGELMHLQTTSLPPKPAKPESQLERQAAHEERIAALVVIEQQGVDSGGSREKKEEVEEEEEEEVRRYMDYLHSITYSYTYMNYLYTYICKFVYICSYIQSCIVINMHRRRKK